MDMVSVSSGYNSESSNEALVLKNDDNCVAFNLPKEILEEEEKSATKTELEKNALKSQVAELDETKRELCYKKLIVLLGKSTHYTNYIFGRLLNSQKLSNEKEDDSSGDNVSKFKGEDQNKRPSNKDTKQKKKDVPNEYINEAGLLVSSRQPQLLSGVVMRDYQLDGLDWLIALYENAVNGILADEMGLGKTIQVISLICHLFSKKIFGPFLIVAPLSTLPNWMLEFSNFAPKINVVLFHGSEQKRNTLKSEFKRYIKSKSKENIPVILTSYEIPLRNKLFFRKVPWTYVIVDEGHRLKNYRSLLSQELRMYSTDNRLILTGTPLQNNLTELWSLLNFLIPEIFNDLEMFENLFDFNDLESTENQTRLIEKEKEQQIISKMHQILEPFLLRRMKCDVNIMLPRKKELLVYTPLTPTQQELYKAVLEGNISKFKELKQSPIEPEITNSGRKKRKCVKNSVSYLYDSDFDDEFVTEIKPVDENVSKTVQETVELKCNFKMLNISMQLRKIVNHPYLAQRPVNSVTNEMVIDENLVNKSGKILVLDAMLPKLKERGHKVLLFSTFSMMLDIIEEYAIMRKFEYVRLDGNYAIDDRMEAIKKFNTNPDVFIFLISTRAGGLGINLTSADTVIIYDSDWNPQVDLQAQDRCHRLGQVRPVVVYRLVTAGTVDEKIIERAASKRRLEKLIVKKGKFKQNDMDEKISITELMDLLKSTDYNKVVHSNGFVFSDLELEELLDRSDLIDTKDTQLDVKSNIFKVIDESFTDIKSDGV